MNRSTSQDPAVTSDDEAISLVEIANSMLLHWRVVGVLPLILAVIAGGWSLSRNRTYETFASFMPQTTSSRGAEGASALAREFGVSIGSERVGESPQFYADLLRSTTLLHEAVLSEYEIPTEAGGVWKGTLVERWAGEEAPGAVPPWRKATDRLHDQVSTAVVRETGVVQFTVSADHPRLAEQIAARMLTLLNGFNLKVRQTRAKEEGEFISSRAEEARQRLRAAEAALRDFLRNNWQYRNSPELELEYDRLRRNVMMTQEIYTSLLRSAEQAKIDAVRDLPVFTVIDSPVGAAEPQGRGTIQNTLVAFLVGLLLAVLFSLLRAMAAPDRKARSSQGQEFRFLARHAWYEIRHPSRWLRPRPKRGTIADQ
jgi:uncharacterized protein involved in exopolysaccharide biosynthesis